jgi:hypothetical protein
LIRGHPVSLFLDPGSRPASRGLAGMTNYDCADYLFMS